MYECFASMYVSICTVCMPDAQRRQKRVLDALELELQVAVNYPM